MNHTEQRKKLRAFLAGSKCVSPASIHDPISARVAEAVGFEIGLLSGSDVSRTVLAAPDLYICTLTEFADHIRRIMRASKLSLLTGIDYGFGNALNVMRAVQEYEHAGASGLGIDDIKGPISYDNEQVLIPIEEGVGKMRAAVAARSDPSLVLIARSPALKIEGMESMLARAKAYAAAGADMIHVSGGAKNPEQLQAVHAATKLPIISGAGNVTLNSMDKREELAACGVRIALQGHHAQWTMLKTLYETYTHLFNGGATADLKPKMISADQMDQLVNGKGYEQLAREYVRS